MSSLRTSTFAPAPICPANYLLRQPGPLPFNKIRRRGRAGALLFRARAASPGGVGRHRQTVAAGSPGTGATAPSGQRGEPAPSFPRRHLLSGS